MLEAPGSPMEWPLQFKQQQTEILELWEACNVSLFHRTYFFLLFRGDPTDSIYMEVERRRLCFLKGTFGGGNQWAKDAPTVALASRLSLWASNIHVSRDDCLMLSLTDINVFVWETVERVWRGREKRW